MSTSIDLAGETITISGADDHPRGRQVAATVSCDGHDYTSIARQETTGWIASPFIDIDGQPLPGADGLHLQLAEVLTTAYPQGCPR